MNGRGKQTFEKVTQVKEVGDETSVPDLPLHIVSDKKNESDDGRARDVRELSSNASNKYRDMLHNNENQNPKELCKEKNAHQSAVPTPYEDFSDEEGELQICEEPLEGDEKEEAQHDNSKENAGRPHNVFSHEHIFEDKRPTAEHIFVPDKAIKTQDVEGSNLTAHQKDDDLEPPHYSCGNQEALPECQAVSSVPDEFEAHCKRKMFTDARDESLMVVSSNPTQKESLSPQQKGAEIELPCSPLQVDEQHIQSNDMLTETAKPIISSDGNLSDVKARGAVELKYCDSSDVPNSLQSEKGFLALDEGSNNLTPKGRKSAEEKASPFRKISRRTINEMDVHGKSREEQEIGDNHSSACMNEVLIHNSSKSSARRISSKARMKYTDLDSLPPSYQTLRRDLNEVLEREKLYQATHPLPSKVRKKPSAPKGGHRRPRECHSTQIINDGEESIPKKIRREQPDGATTELSVKDQGNSSVKEETEREDQNLNTRNLCQQRTDIENADVHHHHQYHKKKKQAIVQPEEMELCHDKPTLPEKESTVSQVCQSNMLSNKRKKCTVRLKRCDRFSWIQCENESTVAESEDISTEETSTSANESTIVESADISTEKTPTSDECDRTECHPEKNVASEDMPSKESDDCSDKSSVLPRHSKIEMENSTSVTKEKLHNYSKQLFTKKNTSQKVHEGDEESHVFTGRTDYVHRFSVENKEHQSSSSKPVELTDEAVCFHGHKVAMEVSQSHHKKILSFAENKNINDSNICAVEDQSKQHLSQIPDEIITAEKTANNPNQATQHNTSNHHLTRQNGVANNMGNKQQDVSVNCGVDKEGNEKNQSTYKVVASHSEGHILQNFVESRSHSPHFENSGCEPQETLFELIDTISTIVSDQKHPIYAIVGRLGVNINIPWQLLEDRIQTEKHEPASEASGDFSTEQLVPEQESQEPNIELQQDRQSPHEQPVSSPEETNEQYITKNQSKKSATASYDSVENLPNSHCETDSQDVVLHQREPAAHTENDSLPSTQHTKCDSQTHDLQLQPHTSQSHQTVTSNQLLIKESLSCSENLKQYSKPTSTNQEEKTRQQKSDQRHVIQPSLNERQASQEKEGDSHNAQAPLLTQQQVQDEHRVMLDTIKQQKQQCSSKQEMAQQKYHKEYQQSSHQQSVGQSHAAVQQWHHIPHASQHRQARCMDMNKVVPQQQNFCSGAPQAEKEASIVQNTMGHHQALLQQQQQMQHLASLEQQPSRQLAVMQNPMEQPQQTVQQQIEWQQQRAAYHASRQHPIVEHQAQHQQQAHPYQHRLYFPQIQQHHQYPHSTEVQTRPNHPHQYHPRFNTPPAWNSNLHLLRQVPYGPLDGQQLQPQQQQYTHFHHQQNLERWHASRRPGTDVAATAPAVLATPSMSGGTVVESEHDRRRILSREAINSFDTGHRIGAVPSSRNANAADFYSQWGAMSQQSRCCADRRFQQKCHYGIPQAYHHYGRAWLPTLQQNLYQVICPMTPANTENIHTAQAHPAEAYMRAGPPLHPSNTTAPMQPPLSTPPIHQRHMGVVPSSTVEQDQRPAAHGGRLKIPSPPVVSAFVERVMKHYQPDLLNTEDTYRHQYKLPEREWAARFAMPQDSVHTSHGTTTLQQLPYSQPVMMFPDHTRIPGLPTQPQPYKTVHAIGQPPHRVVVPPPTSLFDDSVNNSRVNVLENCVQPETHTTNVNIHHLHPEVSATSSKRISPEASLPSARNSENLNCDCDVIDLSQDRNTPEDNGKYQVVKRSDRIHGGSKLHQAVMEKSDSTSPFKAVSEVSQPSDSVQDNISGNLKVNSSVKKNIHLSESLGEKCKSEPLCGSPGKRPCQDPDNNAHALPNLHTHQVTAMDLSPSTVVDCTTKSTPSQSPPHMSGTSCPQLCAISRSALDLKQHAMNGKGASYINCGQQNQDLCTISCCEQNRCTALTKELAAADSACCGGTQQSQQPTNVER